MILLRTLKFLNWSQVGCNRLDCNLIGARTNHQPSRLVIFIVKTPISYNSTMTKLSAFHYSRKKRSRSL